MPRPFDPQPVTREGMHVRLEPLALRHAADLYEVGRDETIWRYMPRPPLKSLEDTQGWIDEALAVSAG
ncbi:MAG: GNAT family N-acetyltransferase, partial [candidate division NC10 bacterium]